MKKFNQLPAAIALAGASLGLGGLLSPEVAAQPNETGSSSASVYTMPLGLDASGMPQLSTARNGESEDYLPYHQGAELEVETSCDSGTAIGRATLHVTVVARPGSEHSPVVWGVEQAGSGEIARQSLMDGQSLTVEGLRAGTVDLAWFEDDDTEGADLNGLTVKQAVARLETLADQGIISENTRDDFRSYPAAFTIPECVATTTTEAPTITTSTTTTTEAPTPTTTSTTTTTEVPEVTSTTSTTVPTIVEIPSTTQPEVVLIPATRIERQLAETGKNTKSTIALSVSMMLAGVAAFLYRDIRNAEAQMATDPQRQ